MAEEKKEQVSSETLLEKIKLKQLTWGTILLLLGYLVSFLPAEEARQMVFKDFGVVQCNGNITISYPINKAEVEGEFIDVTGTVKPIGECHYISLTVKTIEGYYYVLTTDKVLVNPIDGTWEASADLRHIPEGNRARIQAHLCVSNNMYPIGCTGDNAPRGVVHSNEITVRRK